MPAAIVAQSSAFGDKLKPLPLLSVIVPVFNTAPYLKVCLDSLLSPDAESLEIIIVHDGGTDDSPAIAAEWIAVNSASVRACLIDQTNLGLSGARMTGLQWAKGEFIAFLDSDDLAKVNVLLTAAANARKQDCDIVLFRSVVLDGETLETHPFYDAWVWDIIVQGQDFLRTNLREQPRLLRLEPNANTRVIRRKFFKHAGIVFPHGLQFEDFPPHTQEMINASAVGMLNAIGYIYRVNRPGKITEQRGRRRFDALTSMTLTLRHAREARIAMDAMANLALQMVRVLSWCAEYLDDKDRIEFCQKAMVLAREVPSGCYVRAGADFSHEPRERVLLDIFRRADSYALFRLASGEELRFFDFTKRLWPLKLLHQRVGKVKSTE